MTMAEEWPAGWTEAGPDTLWEPPSDAVQARWAPWNGGEFLGRWGGYDVFTYAGGRPGVSLVTENGGRTGWFPLAGLPPRESGKVWVDGALAVARARGLWPEKFEVGPYGPKSRASEGK